MVTFHHEMFSSDHWELLLPDHAHTHTRTYMHTHRRKSLRSSKLKIEITQNGMVWLQGRDLMACQGKIEIQVLAP